MKRLKKVLIFVFCIFSTMSTVAVSQVQTWNTQAREKSQNLHSAALTELAQGQEAQVIDKLNRAIAADSSDPAPYATLGLVLAKEANYSEALIALKKSYALKSNSQTLLTTGFVYYLQHDYVEALNSWNRALELDPRVAEINGDIAYAYLRQGNFSGAESFLRKLIQKKPNSQFAYQGLSLLKYLQGDFEASRKAAQRAQAISSYAPVLLLLAKIEFLQGNRSTAESYVHEWTLALDKKQLGRSMTSIGYPVQLDFHWDPYMVESFDNGFLLSARTCQLPKDEARRKALCAKGKILDALEQAEESFSHHTNDYFLLREFALLELTNGDCSQAAADFASVLKKSPDCYVDWLHLGRAQFLSGKPEEASYAVKEFLAKYPKQKLSPAFLELIPENAASEVEPKSNLLKNEKLDNN